MKSRAGQRGMVGLLLVALLLLGGALFTYSSFNTASVRVDRERATNDALAKAKDALIAYAVADFNRPGQLPCPDVNDDGIEDIAGTCTSLIGRLPWITLGLPDLRDDSGERLWYAVSADFGNGSTVPLNSDTAYRSTHTSLSLTGTTPAANLVAMVISPGGTLTRADGRVQVRGCGATCNPLDFLDIVAGEDNIYENRIFVSAARSSSFNDTLMPVFSDDIMRLVERRAARELAMRLRDHYDMWMNTLDVGGSKGFYPYAVPFVDPSAPAQVGTNGTTTGLMPLGSTPLTWSNFSSACFTESAGTVLRCQAFCAIVLFIPVCLPSYPSGQVTNVGTRFVDPPQPANVQWVLLNLGGTANWTLNPAAGRLDFNYSGFAVVGNLDFRVTAPAPSSWLATSWLTQNNWHQNAGYALSPGYALNGSDSCVPGPACVTVANTTAPTNDKRASVVMTGRALSLTSPVQNQRPVTTPAAADQFLEGANTTLADRVLQQGARTGTFNDTLTFIDAAGAVGP